MQKATQTMCPWSGLADLTPYLRSWLAKRVRDLHELDDILQETLLRAAKYRRCQEDPSKLRFWVLTIARNVLYDSSNRSGRGIVNSNEDDACAEVESREPAPTSVGSDELMCVGTEQFDHDMVVDHLRSTLPQLSLTDQVLLRSYYREGSNCAQIAEQLGLPARVIKVRLFRARKRLGARITRSLERSQRRSA